MSRDGLLSDGSPRPTTTVCRLDRWHRLHGDGLFPIITAADLTHIGALAAIAVARRAASMFGYKLFGPPRGLVAPPSEAGPPVYRVRASIHSCYSFPEAIIQFEVQQVLVKPLPASVLCTIVFFSGRDSRLEFVVTQILQCTLNGVDLTL